MYRSRTFRKALGLSSPNMALTFAALLAAHQWNPSKAASVGGLFHSIKPRLREHQHPHLSSSGCTEPRATRTRR
jgi:hypothetical protein